MKKTKLKSISQNPADQLTDITAEDLVSLPYSEDELVEILPVKPLNEEQRNEYECSLDGVSAVAIPKPKSKEEEEKLVQSFLNGLKKLLSKQDNWTFLQPLTLALEYCAKCQTCSEACPIYVASGKQEIYRPTYRSEVLRRIKKKYLDKGGGIRAKLTGDDIELNWTTIARLAELAYRCTLCRRCAQVCPISIDNGLIAHELRKLFSQEMGIAPKELHRLGTVKQLEVGASTGMSPKALNSILEFMEEEIEEKTGRKIEIPVDKEGADILLIHNAGEFMSWPENPEAFAILLDAAGVSWTLSSELVGYDAVNYGVWYDDFQLAKIALKHAQIAKELKVKKIVVGECGHAHKALIVVADRLLAGEMNIPRESFLPLFEDLVFSGKLRLNPERNNFPVTLHDPCNMVRLTGIVEPQRRILRKLCPQFREMEPHGVDNYCCGGGSGFAIMGSLNFPDWRSSVAGRMKVKQMLETFQDITTPKIRKYVCAPCSNCKGQLRDLLDYYNLEEKHNIAYTGLAELIVNAMADIKEPFLLAHEKVSLPV
ncbi:(Fe-S)-binding protein [Chloroflexota bacterium]